VSNVSQTAKDIQELVRHACERVQRASEIPPRLLDINDAGRYLGMSDKAVRELIVADELPYIQKIPSRSPYLLDVRDLDKWIEQNKRHAGE
jgi:hypothetical protein